MPLDTHAAARAVLEDAMPKQPLPGDKMSEFDRMLTGGNARITFPVGDLAYNGGTRQLRVWAEVLRGLATELERLSQTHGNERKALFYARHAIKAAGVKFSAGRKRG